MSDRWIIEHYGHTDFSDYPQWMPIDGVTYYDTEKAATEARHTLINDRLENHRASYVRDVQECSDRAAVRAKALEAVKGMPQAHIFEGRWSYRTNPISEPNRAQYEKLYRVSRVTTFQERVQALVDSTRSDQVDLDDLKACFVEQVDG